MDETHAAPPRRKWGQNFLADQSTAARIVEALGPLPGETVLEIGPGRGALTSLLVARTRVVAVEIDPRLAERLRRRFDPARLTVLERDVLTIDLAEILSAAGAPASARVVVVGNLPYYISKPVALRLVGARRHVERAVLMFQREVAERLTAVPSTRAYGPLTILTGEAFRIEKLFDLPPHAFRPAPRVVSSVTRWTPRPADALPVEGEAALRACLAASFAMRRRTMANNLRHALGEPAAVDALLRAAEIDPGLRAEALGPEAFRRLARLWPAPPSALPL